MNAYQKLKDELRQKPRSWLVTGCAGFIGSSIVEELLQLGQTVRGLDDFSTGFQKNLDQIQENVGAEAWKRFTFLRGSVADPAACREALKGVELISHQGAIGSVPRSIEDPVTSFTANVQGTMCLMFEAQRAGIKRFVYASSSAVYGDHPKLPKVESETGKMLSPYALTKWVNELTGDLFQRTYGIDTIGLRYFNVFGPRQDPTSVYAAVIPLWVKALMSGESCWINGDGETSRDFCFVKNSVQANLLAATTTNPAALNRAYNISYGRQTTLNRLFEMLRAGMEGSFPALKGAKPAYRDFRDGDIRHSLADISAARHALGYEPEFDVETGLRLSLDWYKRNL